MKSWMVLLIAVLSAGSVVAQGRASRNSSSRGKEAKPNQMIRIKDITPVNGKSDYEPRNIPSMVDKFKVSINHTDNYTKEGVGNWHYFEVAYQVASSGTDDAGKKKPILEIPEVDITYALLYDMSKSKHASSVRGNAEKAGGAIGWEKPSQIYTLLTETVTYTSITPGRDHYAAVCVPPSFAVIHGEPIVFSVQISVDGVQQDKIYTKTIGSAEVDGKKLEPLLFDKDKTPLPWWETIENKTDAIVRQAGVLRDRSLTPFLLFGDQFYDQIKTK